MKCSPSRKGVPVFWIVAWLIAGCGVWNQPPAPVRPVTWAPPPHAEPASDPPGIGVATPTPAPAERAPSNLNVRLRLATGVDVFRVVAPGPMYAVADGREMALPAGDTRFQLSNARPARDAVRLFARSFNVTEMAEAERFAAEWRGRGFDAQPVELGRRYLTASGAVLDNRIVWISMGEFANEAAANARKAELEQERIWSWMRPARVTHGAGTITAMGTEHRWSAPVRLRSSGPITIFLPEGQQQHAGELEMAVGSDGRMEIYETLNIEEYLAGVLPAEMPASWPVEALKAQALAARSDVLAHLGHKHSFEDFDFTTDEMNRVYKGIGRRVASSDEAVSSTRGQIITIDGRICAAVFSANCGGWTDNNDIVWSSPPDLSLRARADFPAGSNPAPNGPVAYGLERWLTGRPPAYCASDDRHFRWRRSFTADELTAEVNKRHAVGRVQGVELGDRGPGGRLEWVRIVGARDTVVVRKELPIRLAFGGLPSAMLILDTAPGAGGPSRYTFIGGGRGHGVGMCQHGARGMADAGRSYQDIVRHYYTGVAIERVE